MKIYKFDDGEFKFYTAIYGAWNDDKRIVFRVRIDRVPEDRAKEHNIRNYDVLTLSTKSEIEDWLKTHPLYPWRDWTSIQSPYALEKQLEVLREVFAEAEAEQGKKPIIGAAYTKALKRRIALIEDELAGND